MANIADVDLTNSLVDIGDVILGYSSGTNFAKLNLHGTAKINSIIRKTGNASSLHEVNLNSSFMELSAAFTGTGIIVTADAGRSSYRQSSWRKRVAYRCGS